MQLIDTLSRFVTPAHVQQIAGQLGASPDQTKTAVQAALPALVTGLGRKVDREEGGASALLGMLDAEGDGSVLDDLGGLLGAAGGSGGAGGLLGAAAAALGGGAGAGSAGGLLGQLLGGRQGAVEQGIAKASGLSGGQVQQLLAMLVPMVLGALGKLRKEEGLDEAGVADKLRQERAELADASGFGGVLEQLLDKDDDGSIADDVAALAGKNLLGGLFGK